MRRSALAIYDVSPFVYCGMSVSNYKTRQTYHLPIGGVLYLTKFVTSSLASGRDVVLAFDSRSFRKDISTEYKKNRLPRNEVYVQLDFLYEMLPKCGITCYKCDGFEADDIIYNLVETHKNNYNAIEIYGTDYDLTHNVCSPNITFNSISSQVNSVNWMNFSRAMFKGSVDILYNTVSAYKVFLGDSSDSIKPFITEKSNIGGLALYNKYKEIIQAQSKPLPVEIIRSRVLLEKFITMIRSYLSDNDVKELNRRMDLVFPAKINSDFSEVTYYNKLDKSNLQEFLSAINDSVSLRTINCYYKTPNELLIQKIKELGNSFMSGEYAVDKRHSVKNIAVNTEVVNLKEF